MTISDSLEHDDEYFETFLGPVGCPRMDRRGNQWLGI